MPNYSAVNNGYGRILYRAAPYNSAYYKFLHAEHVEAVQNGLIKFGSAKKYRLLEKIYNDSWIGDQREGLVVYNIKDGVKIINNEIGKTMEVLCFGNRIVHAIDAIFFSVSFGNIESLRTEFSKNGPFQYDAALKIKNPYVLAREIWLHGRVNGSPVRQVCRGYNVGFCRYSDKSDSELEWGDNIFHGIFGIDLETLPPPDIFLKDRSYSCQNEFRIVLYPHSGIEFGDSIIVEVPVREGLVSSVKISDPVARYLPDLDEAISCIEGLIDRAPERYLGTDIIENSLLETFLASYGVIRIDHGIICAELDDDILSNNPIRLLLHSAQQNLIPKLRKK